MAWIFSQCQDPYGLCIRQYCIFGLSVLTWLLATCSIMLTIRKQSHYSFEIIPLIINALASLSLVCVMSQYEQENIHLIMEVIEIYSYSLLTYSYAGLYLLSTKRITKQQFRKVKILFLVFSALILAAIGGLILLQFKDMIKCQQSHGIGHLILFLLQIPIYLTTFVFAIKTKRHIQQIQQAKLLQQQKQELRVLQNEDQYIKIRYQQANTVIFFFTFSIVLHLATVVMFFVETTNCSETGYLQTSNLYELIMFGLFDLSALLPLLAIPLILFLIPSRQFNSGGTIIITPNPITRDKSEMSYNFVNSQFETEGIQNMIRKKTSQEYK